MTEPTVTPAQELRAAGVTRPIVATAAEQLHLDVPEPGPREARLLERAQYGGTPTITEADLEHARHHDTCPACQDGDRTYRASLDALERTEAARAICVQGLHDLANLVADPKIRAALNGISKRSRRAWTTDRATASLRQTANPAAELERLAENEATRAAAQAALERLAAVRTSDDGLICDACGLILLGTRRHQPVVELYRQATEHAHRCKPTPKGAHDGR